LKSILKAPS